MQPNKRAPINDIQTHIGESGLQVLSNTKFRQILRTSNLVNFNASKVCLAPLDIWFVNHYLKLAENVHVGKKSKNTPLLPFDVKLDNERLLLHKEWLTTFQSKKQCIKIFSFYVNKFQLSPKTMCVEKIGNGGG